MKVLHSLGISSLTVATSVTAHTVVSLSSIPSFTTLNNSGVTGSAMLTLNDGNAQQPTLRAQIMAAGLDPAGGHPHHIHGNFTAASTTPFRSSMAGHSRKRHE